MRREPRVGRAGGRLRGGGVASALALACALSAARVARAQPIIPVKIEVFGSVFTGDSAGSSSNDAALVACRVTGTASCAAICTPACANATNSASPSSGSGELRQDFTGRASLAETPGERGFTVSFAAFAQGAAGGLFNQLRAKGNGVRVQIFAQVPAGQELIINGKLEGSASVIGAAPISAGASFNLRRCGNGGGLNTAQSCTVTPDTQVTDGEGFLLIEDVDLAFEAFLDPEPSDKAAEVTGSFSLNFKVKGIELQQVSGPLEGFAGEPFAEPFVVRTFDNATGAAVAGQEIAYQLKDAAGNPVGAVPTAVATTQPDGAASANFVVPDAGDYRVEASCAGCAAGSPAAFLVTVRKVETFIELPPGAESGDGQRAKAGTTLPIPLRVRVKDTRGNLRPGFRVRFTANDPNGTPLPGAFSNPQPVSDGNGIASAVMTLGAVVGTYAVLADCLDCTGIGGGLGAAAAGGGGAPSGKTQNLREFGEPRPPSSPKRSPEPRPGPGTCDAVIEQVDPTPDGNQPLTSPGFILGCMKQSIKLRCSPSQGNPGPQDECTDWSFLPLRDSVQISRSASSPLEASLFSALPETLFLEATYVQRFSFEPEPRICRAERTAIVGALDVEEVVLRNAEELTNKGIAPGRSFAVAAVLKQTNPIPSEDDLKRFVRVEMLDSSNEKPVSDIRERPGSRRIFQGNLLFAVDIASKPLFDLPLDPVIVRVTACGLSKDSDRIKILTTP